MTSTPEAHKVKIRLPKVCDPPSPVNPAQQQVWIIFGASSQIAASLIQHCLESNDKVVAVGSTSEDTHESTEKFYSSNSNAVDTCCDVRCRTSVKSVIDLALLHFKQIDIIANCVEYGVIGSCEDQDEYELRNHFETNFMGTLHIIQTTFSHLKKQGSGRYLFFNTTPGALGIPGLGPFYATKCAVEGLLESMLYEIDQFNVKLTLIECGWVGKDVPELEADRSISSFSSSSSLSTWGHFILKSPSEPYSQANGPALHAKRLVQWLCDKQPLCHVKCAELIWQLGHCNDPPLRLSLGSYAIESLRDRMRCLVEELEDWTYLHFPLTAGESTSGEESEERREVDDSL
ncbi:putative oxidoreductase [Golovinomyces cichoracearum]|uniref:Putative oxidoreductase n=1 Tax=Golovinomyces cichoracearum TaxID=62708 RepID=A0A420HL62_9PEZI|nr:putative oxidoreductase [Golovinomyces cichoracearum]